MGWITVHGHHVYIENDDTKYTSLHNLTHQQTTEWMNANSNYDEWKEYVEDNEYFDSVYKYTGETYGTINHYLRTGEFKKQRWFDKDDADEDIKEIDDCIKNFELKKPIIVYRASDTSLFGDSDLSYNELVGYVGKTVTDKAYMSTSTLKSLPGEQTVGGKVRYQIDIPSGKGKAAYVSKFSENSQEREVLIARNTSYTVTKVSKDTDGFIVVNLKLKEG